MERKLNNNKFPIFITHIVNPSMFYFKYDMGAVDDGTELNTLVQIYSENEVKYFPHGYKPKIGEIIAVFFKPWEKWIRAQVDDTVHHLSGKTEYVLWSLDKGIPMLSTHHHILPLSDELKHVSHSTFCGGIGYCQPSQREFNYHHMRMENVVRKDWLETSVRYFEQLIENSAEIFFLPEFANEKQQFGDLHVITTTGQTISVREELIKIGQAVNGPHVNEIKNSNTSNKERWENNQGNLDFDKVLSNSESVFAFAHCDVRNRKPPAKILEVETKIAEWKMRNKIADVKLPTIMNIAGSGYKRRVADFENAEFNLRNPAISLNGGVKSVNMRCGSSDVVTSPLTACFKQHTLVSNTKDRPTSCLQGRTRETVKEIKAMNQPEGVKKLPVGLQRIIDAYEMDELKKQKIAKRGNINYLPCGYPF